MCILILTIALLLSSDVNAQSAAPDSIFLMDGGVIVVRVISLKGGNVSIISPEGGSQNFALDEIEKIVDSRGRVIYWRNRVSSQGFGDYLARSRGKQQKLLEVGVTRDRRRFGDDWTQFTPRIGWIFSPGFTIELSGGRKKFVEDNLLLCFGDGCPRELIGSSHSERTRNIFQVHITKKFSALTDHLSSYSVIGVGRYWGTKQFTETSFGEIDLNRTWFYTEKGFIVDGGFGLLFLVAKHFPVRAETRFEGWLTDFAIWAVSIGISWRIPL